MNFGLFSLARYVFIRQRRPAFHAGGRSGSVVGSSRAGAEFLSRCGFGGIAWRREYSVARDISDSGQVVGESQAATGMRAFRWTSDGGMQDLGDFPGGNDFSRGYGINNDGHVVGDSSIVAAFRVCLDSHGRYANP